MSGFRIAPVGALSLAVSCLSLGACAPEPDPGGPRELLIDEAELLDAGSETRVEGLLQGLREERGVELVALTVAGLGGKPIDRFATERFETWRIGDDFGGRGLLLVISRDEERVRLEVGYALEGWFSDAFVDYVERAQLAPWFADGRIGPGVEATVELLVDRAFREAGVGWGPSTDPGQTTAARGFLSGGAGAEAEVPFQGGSERQPTDEELRRRFAAQPTPIEAWTAFLETNRLRIKDPDLGIYDGAARRRMASTVTDAGQAHLARLYEGAQPTVRQQGTRGVVLFLDDPDHRLAPWFFHRTPEGWRLDGATIPEIVGYNHRNQWRFRSLDHPYMFAFHDFRFDSSGFAHRLDEGAG